MKNPKSFAGWLKMARNCSLNSFKRLRKEQQDILYLDYDKYRIKAVEKYAPPIMYSQTET